MDESLRSQVSVHGVHRTPQMRSSCWSFDHDQDARQNLTPWFSGFKFVPLCWLLLTSFSCSPPAAAVSFLYGIPIPAVYLLYGCCMFSYRNYTAAMRRPCAWI